MKYTIRSFSVGLLTTGLIMLAVYYFFGNETNNQANMETDEMISHIEQEGYRVLTEKEYIAYSVANTNQDENEEELANEENEEAPEEETASTKEKDEEAEEQKKADEKEKAEKEEKEKAKDEKEEEDKEEESAPKTVTINIPSGMASSQISALLQEEKIIDNAEDFNAYLQDNDYSLRVQIGTHKLTQGMSFYEIAEALTN